MAKVQITTYNGLSWPSPHMTVAYLKSGLCKKYTDMLNNTKNPLKPRYIIYTHPDGEKTRIDL